MPKVNKAPLTLSLSLSLSTVLSISLSLTLAYPLSPTLFFLVTTFYPSNSASQPLSLISPLQPFSGLYREGSNLRFILPPISNLRDPCCWRRIFSGPDASRPVKLKSVKNGKIFNGSPCLWSHKTGTPSMFCTQSLMHHLSSPFLGLWFRAYCLEARDTERQKCAHSWKVIKIPTFLCQVVKNGCFFLIKLIYVTYRCIRYLK